jgi:hypothetical protein
LKSRILTNSEHIKLISYTWKQSYHVLRVKFSSVISIQIFSLKNANPSLNEIHAENDYFPLPSKFEMIGGCKRGMSWIFMSRNHNTIVFWKQSVYYNISKWWRN